MNATWKQLRSGAWGIRAQGSVNRGDVVTVTTKAGKTEQRTVAKVVWSGNGITYATVEPRAEAYVDPETRTHLAAPAYRPRQRKTRARWMSHEEADDQMLQDYNSTAPDTAQVQRAREVIKHAMESSEGDLHTAFNYFRGRCPDGCCESKSPEEEARAEAAWEIAAQEWNQKIATAKRLAAEPSPYRGRQMAEAAPDVTNWQEV